MAWSFIVAPLELGGNIGAMVRGSSPPSSVVSAVEKFGILESTRSDPIPGKPNDWVLISRVFRSDSFHIMFGIYFMVPGKRDHVFVGTGILLPMLMNTNYHWSNIIEALFIDTRNILEMVSSNAKPALLKAIPFVMDDLLEPLRGHSPTPVKTFSPTVSDRSSIHLVAIDKYPHLVTTPHSPQLKENIRDIAHELSQVYPESFGAEAESTIFDLIAAPSRSLPPPKPVRPKDSGGTSLDDPFSSPQPPPVNAAPNGLQFQSTSTVGHPDHQSGRPPKGPQTARPPRGDWENPSGTRWDLIGILLALLVLLVAALVFVHRQFFPASEFDPILADQPESTSGLNGSEAPPLPAQGASLVVIQINQNGRQPIVCNQLLPAPAPSETSGQDRQTAATEGQTTNLRGTTNQTPDHVACLQQVKALIDAALQAEQD